MHDALPGLPDRYRVERELGRGAAKRVYLARDAVLDRAVAIAAMDAPPAAAVSTPLDEARAMARLGDLPHVVSIYDVVDAGDRFYLVSQYLPGGDLGSHLAAAPGGRVPVRRAIRIAAQVAQALRQAHEHGICHRDVKPQNVFLDARADALLGDFGLAASTTFAEGTAGERRVGTLAYMAPEQAWGAAADPRSDLYALGCVLYQLLTGRPPFAAESPAALLYQHEHEVPVPPTDRDAAVPTLVSELVMALLAKRPEARPACAADVHAALAGMGRALAAVETGDSSRARDPVHPLVGRRLTGAQLEPPFVGRGEQLQALEHALRAARAGRPAVLLIAGAPGAGKTRLLRELGRRASEGGDVFLVGHGSEDVPLPNEAFVEVLLPLAGRLGELEPDDAATIRRFLQLDGAEERALEPRASDRRHLYRAVTRALATFSRSRPLVLAIDDLHWCDQASLELFEHLALELARPAPGRPRRVVLAGLHRPAEATTRHGRLLERLALEPASTVVTVPGMSENDLLGLLEGLGIERPSNQLIHLVHGATGGNPLFVRELIRHLESRGEILRRGGFAVTSPAALQSIPTAATAIAARVAELSETTRQLLALGAVLGPRFDLAMLAAIAGADEDQAVDRLDQAVSAGLLIDQGQAYMFSHPVVRQACLDLPSRSRRERLHLRIGMHLHADWEQRPRPDVLPRLAHHLVRAGAAAPPDMVCRFGRRGATRALAHGAWHEAAELFDAILEADARGGVWTSSERAEVHRAAGYAYQQLSDEGPCFAHLDAAIEGFRAAGERAGLAGALAERARARVIFGKVVYNQLDDVRALEEALALLGDDRWRLRATVLGALAVTYWAGGRSAGAEALAQQGLALARAHGDDSLCAELCWDLASAQQQALRLREALAACEAGLVHARRAGVPASSATCLQRMPLVLFMLGRLDQVEATVREARELNRVACSAGDESVALAMLAALAAVRGELGRAERWVGEAMRLHGRIGYAWGGILALVARAHCHAIRGARRAAMEAIDEILRPGRVFDDPSALAATFEPNRLLIDVYAGRTPSLAATPAGFLPPPSDLERLDFSAITAYCFQVELAAAAGRPDLAAPLEAALAFAEERGVVLTIGWPFLVARIRGLAAGLAGRVADAGAHFARAGRLAERRGARPELGRALLDHARLLLAHPLHHDDRERVAAMLRRAEATFLECGMTRFAAAAETHARQLATPERASANPLRA